MKHRVVALGLGLLILLIALCGCNKVANCAHCGKKVQWKYWDSTGSLPTEGGHWVLKNDVTVAAEQQIGEGRDVVVDLSGKTVKNSGTDRIYHINGKDSNLTVLDSDGGGKMVVTGELDLQGGGIMVTAGSFAMHQFTLDAGNATNLQDGGAIYVAADGSFHMHSGTIVGAKLVNKQIDTGVVSGGSGGSVAVAGTMTMDSGVIRDGQATAFEEIVVEGDTPKILGVYNGRGGNIYGTGDSTIIINNGEILNGRAGVSGGNVYMDGFCLLRMYNGTISGGKTTLLSPGGEKTNPHNGGGGGNAFVSNTSDFCLYGGTVRAGQTNGYGGNLRCEGLLNMKGGWIGEGICLDRADVEYDAKSKNIIFFNGKLSMDGGEIAGYAEVSDYYDSVCDIRVAGTAKINGGEGCTSNLSLCSGVRVTVAKMEPGADVHMHVQNGAFTNKTNDANMKYVTLDNDNAQIKSYDGVYYINSRLNCICGLNSKGKHFGDCDGSVQIWGEWTSTEKLPTNPGYYYLANDVNMKETALVRGQKQIFLDFNGKTANNGKANFRLYSLFDTTKEITLTLTDTSEKKNGGLRVHGRLADQGMAVWCRSRGHSMVLYGGILDASDTTCRKDGTAICGHGGTSITIHGGTVIGGQNIRYDYKNADGTTSILGGCAGAVCVEGYFHMTGGEIRSGAAVGKQRPSGMDTGEGGNLYISTKGEALIEGGTIYGGSAYRGGNITAWGVLKITGGHIYGGKATDAGDNIFLYNSVSAQIDSKYVDGGISYFKAS